MSDRHDSRPSGAAADAATEWNFRYAKPGYAYGTEPNRFLVSVADRLPPGRVLSLGEGEGRNAVFLAVRGHDVTAVDASEVGLAKARQLAAEQGVSISTVVADLAEYRIDHGWDAIISIFCHLPASVRRRMHGDVAAALRPGGVFVLEAYTPRQLEFGTGGPPVRALLVSLEELRGELAGLEMIVARETEREVHEGRCHFGQSAVVHVVARKP